MEGGEFVRRIDPKVLRRRAVEREVVTLNLEMSVRMFNLDVKTYLEKKAHERTVKERTDLVRRREIVLRQVEGTEGVEKNLFGFTISGGEETKVVNVLSVKFKAKSSLRVKYFGVSICPQTNSL